MPDADVMRGKLESFDRFLTVVAERHAKKLGEGELREYAMFAEIAIYEAINEIRMEFYREFLEGEDAVRT